MISEEILKELMNKKSKTPTPYVRILYKEPKQYNKVDYLDAEDAKIELKKLARTYGGKVVEVAKETKNSFAMLVEFKSRKDAKTFEHTVDDAGRTKLARTIYSKEGKWWDINYD